MRLEFIAESLRVLDDQLVYLGNRRLGVDNREFGNSPGRELIRRR